MNATTPRKPSSKSQSSAGRGKTKTTESAAAAPAETAASQSKKAVAAATKARPISKAKSSGKAQTKQTGTAKATTTATSAQPTATAKSTPKGRVKEPASPPSTRAASTTKAAGPASKKPGASAKAATKAKKPASTSREAKAPAGTALAGNGSAKAKTKLAEGTAGSTTKPSKPSATSAAAKAKPAIKANATTTTRKTAARKKKKASPRPEGFKNGSWVVHPSHGPGRVTGSQRQTIGGQTLELITITYGREMARLMVPVDRLKELGLRPISSKAQIQAATNTLKKPARITRTMWSRRAQDYESKLHSGDLVQIAEVLRDLYRAPDGPEQSFSERELYKDALDRFSRELAAAEKNLTEEKAIQRLEGVLRRAS